MTVIAWDGRSLAADKRMCSGNAIYTVSKLTRHGHYLIGGAGTAATELQLMEWFKSGADPATFPEACRSYDYTGRLLVVNTKDGSAMRFDSGPYPLKLDRGPAAIGCGDEGAMIAMACGKTAEEAVKIVSQFNSMCGNGVDVLHAFEG